MDSNEHVWALILAAGEGSRLRSLTTDDRGVAVPKQFCGLQEGRSMLRSTIDRAVGIVPKERIVAIVASQHRHWWKEVLSDLPAENILVQPRNRGTAVGILYPLLQISLRDPHARVLVLPSDHYVENEAVLREAIREALTEAGERRNRIVLLGMQPDSPDPDYGWVLPASGGGGLRKVTAFVEKPPLDVARELMGQGGLWNSFVFVGAVGTFLRLYARASPEILLPFLANHRDLVSIYESLPARDFSRDILEKTVDRLWVLPVGPCGWSDLGTPRRIAAVLNRGDASLGRSGDLGEENECGIDSLTFRLTKEASHGN